MYLKITEPNQLTQIRQDFYKCEYDATKIIIENLLGRKEPICPTEGQTIELIDEGEVVTTLQLTLFEIYKIEEKKNAQYLKKGELTTTRDYTRWLAKRNKGRQY